MSKDPGAQELAAVLEAPSVALEEAIQALGTSLEAAHAGEEQAAKLPAGAGAPIAKLQRYYRELLRHVSSIETSNPGRHEAIKALQRMGEGLGNLAAAVSKEGEEAEEEAALGADLMQRAGTELEHALGRLT
jgi:hypothetical protein